MIIRTTTVTRLLCPPLVWSLLVVSEQIFNRQYYFSSFYWFRYQAALFFLLSTAKRRNQKGKKNQARRLQCLINTGSRRVCNAAQPTGCESDRSHSSSRASESTTTMQYFQPLLTNKKPKLDKRERHETR